MPAKSVNEPPQIQGWARLGLVLMGVALLVALVAVPSRLTAQQASPVAPPFSGETPKTGEVGLLMTTREVTPADLSAALSTAGCAPTVIAVTVGGQWQVFVGGNPPTFVNAPFLVAVPALAASTGFFVRCQPAATPTPTPTGTSTATPGTLSLAPIDEVVVVRSDAETPSYWATITSGLPSGCAAFERIDAERTGDSSTISVWNRVTVPASGACTAIYGMVTNRVALTGDFVSGQQYTVVVNGQTTTFTAGSAVPVGGPAAPVNVKLTGALPDLSVTVPPGEGEQGRVTITWEYTGTATGFKVYQRDCNGVPTGTPIEVAAVDHMYGPLQPCRPGGNVGVSAVSAAGESPIAWWK